VQTLRAFYAAHIAVEDHERFPLARQLLARPSGNAGHEMAARYGLDFNKLPAGSRRAARCMAPANTHQLTVDASGA